MKMMKNVVALFLFFFLPISVFAYTLTQLESANYLAEKGIITNYQNDVNGYNLDGNILRQEIAGIIAQIIDISQYSTTYCKGYFVDLTSTNPNSWACASIETLVDLGIINKSENFRPEDYITKAEAVGMFVNSLYSDEYEYDSQKNSWWQTQVVEFAVQKGILERFTDYNENATRGFVFELIADALKIKENLQENIITNKNDAFIEDSQITENISTTTSNEEMKNILCEVLGICKNENVENIQNENYWATGNIFSTVSTNELNVYTNYDFSQNISVIPATGIVSFGNFYFSAKGKDVTLSSITIKREGLGSSSDIKRVYFEDNGVRVSNRSNVGSDGTAILTFYPEIEIPAGSTQSLNLMVELSGAGIGSEHKFSIKTANDIESSAQITGDFPVSSSLERVSSYSASQVKITAIDRSSFQIGTRTNVLFTEFTITSFGDNNHTLQGLTLRNYGDANMDNLSNIGLYRNGKEVSYNYTISGRDLKLNIYDEIKSGTTVSYQLRGDIIKWEKTGETFSFQIRTSADVSIIEENTGFSPTIIIE